MNKLFLCIVFMCFIEQSAYSQFFIDAGFNFAKITQKYEYESYKASTSFIFRPSVGIYYRYYLNSSFGLKLGLNFSEKGCVVKTLEDDRNKWVIDYLEVPLTIMVKIRKVEVEAGGYWASGLYGKYVFDNNHYYRIHFKRSNISDVNMNKIHIKAFDYGFTSAISVYFTEKIKIRTGVLIGKNDITPSWTFSKTNNVISKNLNFFILAEYRVSSLSSRLK